MEPLLVAARSKHAVQQNGWPRNLLPAVVIRGIVVVSALDSRRTPIMVAIFRVLSRYELEPIHRGETSFIYAIEILRELDKPDPALKCRVCRKEFFRLVPSTFRADDEANGEYSDEELFVEDVMFDSEARFDDEKSALQHTVHRILDVLGVQQGGT
jgi:hypothetical protein